ncbi:universal stress protein PHOS32-like isoform X1 [Apium graveolens]|uniref:universal stress protein PHOS32-like isoform X1 n=1 Tax=Apium graveolens TaxID=4045 RepID=UPI003D7B49D6
MERKIIVAVDEGEESSYALSWSLNNIFCSSNDTLILLCAKPARTVYPYVDETGRPRDLLLRQGYLFSQDIVESMERYVNEVAESVVRKAKKVCQDYPQIKVEIKVETGDARDVICEAAEKLNADMVVLGSHGYGALKRAFLGSVSNHCAQNIKCPVLIVKRPKIPSPTSPHAAAAAAAGTAGGKQE